MNGKPIVSRDSALRDIEETVAYYLAEGSAQAVKGFVAALKQASAHIGRNPATGSLRYAHSLNLHGLRSWPLKRYPQLVFYVEREAHVEIWRVLHGRRDLSEWLQMPASPMAS